MAQVLPEPPAVGGGPVDGEVQERAADPVGVVPAEGEREPVPGLSSQVASSILSPWILSIVNTRVVVVSQKILGMWIPGSLAKLWANRSALRPSAR
jgi:hypothetical protein